MLQKLPIDKEEHQAQGPVALLTYHVAIDVVNMLSLLPFRRSQAVSPANTTIRARSTSGPADFRLLLWPSERYGDRLEQHGVTMPVRASKWILVALLVGQWEAAALDFEVPPPHIERANDIALVAELMAPNLQNRMIDGIFHVEGRTYRVSSGECWFVVVLKHTSQGTTMSLDVVETNCAR